MKQFYYTVKDEIGIHARPAGLLAKKVKEFSSTVKIEKGSKSAIATKVFAVMGLGIKCGDVITVTAEGSDEEIAIESLKHFFETTL